MFLSFCKKTLKMFLHLRFLKARGGKTEGKGREGVRRDEKRGKGKGVSKWERQEMGRWRNLPPLNSHFGYATAHSAPSIDTLSYTMAVIIISFIMHPICCLCLTSLSASIVAGMYADWIA